MNRGDILKNLKTKGICVIRDYWSRQMCEKSLEEISTLDVSKFSIGQGGDIRCQHSNKFLPTAKEFMNDSFIGQVARGYSECYYPDRSVLGIVRPIDGKRVDSGGGWHIDREEGQQFKSIIYLNDVTSNNAPFIFASESRDMVPELRKYSNLRISEQEMRDKIPQNRIIEVTGPAGTCILVDTTYPHRGKEISEGVRYSYTTYYYENRRQS